MRIIFISLLIFSVAFAEGQNAYQLRRNWVVGYYSGMWKDSTAQTPWQPINITVDYSTNTLNPEHDSMVVVSFDNNEYYIWSDSTYLLYHNLADPNQGGKLYADSTFIYHYISPSMSGGHMIYFIGKLVQSYAGVNELFNSEQVKVFPNPANDKLHVHITNNLKVEYTLIDTYGREVKKMNQKEIDVSNLPNGIYIFRINTEKGIISKKIIVQP